MTAVLHLYHAPLDCDRSGGAVGTVPPGTATERTPTSHPLLPGTLTKVLSSGFRLFRPTQVLILGFSFFSLRKQEKKYPVLHFLNTFGEEN